MVERYRKRHLAAQVRSANGLRGIFKFSEIVGSTSYVMHLYVYYFGILVQDMCSAHVLPLNICLCVSFICEISKHGLF